MSSRGGAITAVELSFELGAPLEELEAAVPLRTGPDLLELLGTLVQLDQYRESRRRTVSWRLREPRGRSASLHAINQRDLAGRAVVELVQGFQSAEESELLPQGWNVSTGLKAARIADRLGDTKATGLLLVASGDERVEAEITRQAGRHLRVATKLRFTSYGTVTGTLGRINSVPARRASLWSDMDGRRVEIAFPAQHQEAMRDAWAAAHVEITGVLHENAGGQVLQVDMDSIEVIEPGRSTFAELPGGFYPEMTGGLGSVEYLRLIRGES